jgi:hypothetical protein
MSFERRFRDVRRRSAAAASPSQIPSFLREPRSCDGAVTRDASHLTVSPRRIKCKMQRRLLCTFFKVGDVGQIEIEHHA